jgi:membrane-associated phospholipid phosphatase
MTENLTYKPTFLQKFLGRNYKWWLARITWFLVILLSLYFYKLTNKATENIHTLKFSLDDLIPFVPIFVIPYLLYLPFVGFCLIEAIFKLNKRSQIFLILFLVSQIFANFIYLIFQTEVQRPLINSGFFDNLVQTLVYQNDNPYNAFPSLHVIDSLLCGWYLKESKNYFFVYLFIFLVIISTVLIKQHYLVDILGGIVWCFVLYFLAKPVFKLGLKKNEAVGL